MARIDADTEGAGGSNLAERIRRLANGRHTLDVAQFQFVGIADIRRRYDPRWPAKRVRVNQIASHFISRRIAPDDVLIAGTDGYLLVSGSLTGGAADHAARRLSAELNAYFLGEPDFDDIQIGSQHHAMSIDDFAETFGAMLAAAGRMPAATNAPDPFSMGFTPLWNARSGALSAVFATPVERATGAPLDWDLSTHRHAEMGERKLEASEVAMRSLWTSGGRAVVGVAVHVSTLNSQQLMQVGVSFICSPRIWPVRSHLTSAELWPASRLVAKAQKTAAA